MLFKHKTTLFYLLSFAFIQFITRCHSLSFIVIFCYSLPFTVTRCHSLSFVLTCCTTRCHSLSLVVIRCAARCYSLSFVVIRCHSLSLDVPLVCLFMNDRHRTCSVKKRCQKFCEHHRKTPMLESVFNKIAGVQAYELY